MGKGSFIYSFYWQIMTVLWSYKTLLEKQLFLQKLFWSWTLVAMFNTTDPSIENIDQYEGLGISYNV